MCIYIYNVNALNVCCVKLKNIFIAPKGALLLHEAGIERQKLFINNNAIYR